MIYLGKLTNTHGLKGEVKIISDFKYKNDVFQIGNNLYIDQKPLIIKSYRPHKNYDMVTFEGVEDINDALKYKGKNVYINEDEYEFEGPLNEDLIGMNIYQGDKLIGKLIEIENTGYQELLVIKGKTKNHLVPFLKPFINKITDDGIYLNEMEGLINED